MKIKLYFIIILIFIFIIEIVLRFIGFSPPSSNSIAKSIQIVGDEIFEEDSLLFIKNKDGFAKIIHHDSLTFQVTIKNGIRQTPYSNHSQTSTKVYFFGSSFTFGYGVDDDKTYVNLIAKDLPNCDVRNYGRNGINDIQAIQILKEQVEINNKPDFAVFNFSIFHPERNILLDRYRYSLFLVQHINYNSNLKTKINQGYMFIDKNFELKTIKTKDIFNPIPLYDKSSILNLIQIFKINQNDNRLHQHSIKATNEILQNLISYCNEKNIKLIVFDFYPNHILDDFYKNSEHKNNSVYIKNIVNWEDRNLTNYPYDSHPNEKGHRLIYKQLIPKLYVIIQNYIQQI